MTYQEATLSIQDLPRERTLLGLFRLGVLGPMRRYIDQRYESAELMDEDRYVQEEFPLLKQVRAFRVPNLIGKCLSASGEDALLGAFAQMLKLEFPDLQLSWQPDKYFSSQRLRKCFLLHESIPAPMDHATGQRMSLEVFGQLTHVGRFDLATDAGRDALQDWSYSNIKDGERPPLEQDLSLEIQIATYANLQHPGVGVPLYL
jgi:hypothetical protein